MQLPCFSCTFKSPYCLISQINSSTLIFPFFEKVFLFGIWKGKTLEGCRKSSALQKKGQFEKLTLDVWKKVCLFDSFGCLSRNRIRQYRLITQESTWPLYFIEFPNVSMLTLQLSKHIALWLWKKERKADSKLIAMWWNQKQTKSE